MVVSGIILGLKSVGAIHARCGQAFKLLPMSLWWSDNDEWSEWSCSLPDESDSSDDIQALSSRGVPHCYSYAADVASVAATSAAPLVGEIASPCWLHPQEIWNAQASPLHSLGRCSQAFV